MHVRKKCTNYYSVVLKSELIIIIELAMYVRIIIVFSSAWCRFIERPRFIVDTKSDAAAVCW